MFADDQVLVVDSKTFYTAHQYFEHH